MVLDCQYPKVLLILIISHSSLPKAVYLLSKCKKVVPTTVFVGPEFCLKLERRVLPPDTGTARE